jgi:hypothetical protein
VTPRHADTASTGRVEPVSRFTVRFYDQGAVDRLEDWRRDARRTLRAPVHQAEVIRVLLDLLTEDQALSARVVDRLSDGGTGVS